MKHNMKGRKGDKQDVAEFTQIKPGLFVFCSNFHFSMSKINITAWQRCGVVLTMKTMPMQLY